MPAPINPSAPGAMPADARALLTRWGLSSATVLTTDRQSPKLRHGQARARSVILYTLPARSLAEAINPDNPAGGPRSFIPELFALAEAHGLTQKARAYNGCPWATAGCGPWAAVVSAGLLRQAVGLGQGEQLGYERPRAAGRIVGVDRLSQRTSGERIEDDGAGAGLAVAQFRALPVGGQHGGRAEAPPGEQGAGIGGHGAGRRWIDGGGHGGNG